MALAVASLIAVEVIERRCSALGEWSVISVVGIEAIVDVAVEAAGSMEPRAGSEEETADEPVRAIIAIGCAVVGGVIEVAIGAHGCSADINADGDLGGSHMAGAQKSGR